MGNDHSHSRHHHDSAATGAATTTTEQPKAKPALPPVLEKCDVMISSANNADDINLVTLLKGGLENASIPVFAVSNESKEVADQAGQVLVDAKLLVFVASEAASNCGKCQDQVSLAYVSDKPIIVVTRSTKDAVQKSFNVGMRLTLTDLRWFIFDKPEEEESVSKQFVQLIQEQLSPNEAPKSVSPEPGAAPAPLKRRLNTKLRAQSTVKDLGGDEPHINTFWDRNFPDEGEVPWFRFQQAFLLDYASQLSGLFDEDNIPWLLGMLKNDIFDGKEKITREQFMGVRGDSRDKNAFWRVISQVAIEKFNMREVFNMNSTVRLTAIEKLAAFQNPAVIDALIRLLEDEDPNVRAVAAISLGRTGKSTEQIVDSLIGLLKDGDRIVRQSACLSLGTLKAAKAIKPIGDRWRNDFISVVRNAARTALENMNLPEAKEVLQVTKVLEDEIESLAGKQVAV